jgi:hypothetical protein
MVLYDDYNLIIGKQAFDSNGQAEDWGFQASVHAQFPSWWHSGKRSLYHRRGSLNLAVSIWAETKGDVRSDVRSAYGIPRSVCHSRISGRIDRQTGDGTESAWIRPKCVRPSDYFFCLVISLI